jgi:hypothetical protein
VVTVAASTPAAADAVLVLGSASSADTIASHLVAAGHTVTRNSSDSVPSFLTPYASVWVHTLTTLSFTDLVRLEAFVEAGRGVYINGELAGCCLNTSANADALVNATVTGAGSILVGDGSFSGVAVSNPTAVDGITQTPHVPISLSISGGGRILGVAAANQVASLPGGHVVAAAWRDADMVSGQGRLVVVGDSNWVSASDPSTDEWVANFQRFLMPDSDGDGVPDLSDLCPIVPAPTADGCPAAVPTLPLPWLALLVALLVAGVPAIRRGRAQRRT